MTHDLHPNEKLVFGNNAERHPITGLPIELGSGALSPDEQARRVHLPYIARTQGISVAEAMLIDLDAAAKNRKHIERIKET
jgi:hypothetical protein